MDFVKVTVTVIAAVLALALATMVISSIDDSTQYAEDVSGIAAFVNDEGTTATYLQGAIYSADGSLMGTTGQIEFVRDSWNTMRFSRPIRIDTKDNNFILAVQGDGQISVPADGENYIVQDAEYGTFPAQLDGYAGNDSKLSIYAIYA